MKSNRLPSFILLFALVLFSSFSFSQNHIEINPGNLDLGEWPVGAWQKPSQLYLTNSGFDELEIFSSELQDLNSAFILDNINTPFSLTPFEDTAFMSIALTNESLAEGIYTSQYTATCDDGNSVSTSNVMVNAYLPPEGDVYENAITLYLPYSEQNITTSFPTRSNYQLLSDSKNGNDLVYKFELTEDVIIDIQLSNASSSSILALYKEDFMGDDGPSYDNAVEISLMDSLEAPLFSGNYYLVVSSQGENSDFSFDLDISSIAMPAPGVAYNPNPENYADSVPCNNTILSFHLSELTTEYNLFLDTINPPTLLLIDWCPAQDSASFPIFWSLIPFKTYYWRVNSQNNTGTTMGDIWQFNTFIAPPKNVTAAVLMIDPYEYDVLIEWTSSGKSFQKYNIYRNDSLIGTSLPGTQYFTDHNVNPNMNPCHEYWIEAVWDEGVSAPSNAQTVCIPGNGNLRGEFTDIETGELISGKALVTLTSETGGFNYTKESYDNGEYSFFIESDTYEMNISHPKYLTEMANSIEVNLQDTTTQDFQLIPFPFTADTVIAEIINDTTAQIEWSADSTFIDRIISYEVYRKPCNESANWELIAETTELIYLDEDWNTLELEEYKYAVKTVYNLNTSDFKESNCTYTEPDVSVEIEVTTLSGDSPTGCEINFKHVLDTSINYDVEMDGTGWSIIDEFRKGIYNISVELYGYETLEYENVLINDDTTFVFLLYNQGLQIRDLYVTPTGFASWDGEYPSQSVNIVEDFEDSLSDGWTILDDGNTSDTWTIVNDPEFNNSYFLMCNSLETEETTIMNEYLLSPTINAAQDVETFLEWDQNYQNASVSDYFEIEVFDGYNWIQIYFQDFDDNPWPEIKHHILDISQYANSYLQVRFHYVANSNAWYIGIDNIKIYQNNGKSNKYSGTFRVFLNSEYLESTMNDIMFYDYTQDENLELIEGETYLTEVQAAYVTLGPKAAYEWTYLPSGSFQGPNNFDVYNMEGTNDMQLNWTNPDPLDVVEINQSYGEAEVAHYQKFDNGYGVVFDFSSYPDAIINAMDFRHSSWGLNGNWDYIVHLIDWETKTTLVEIGPLQTTQNDGWEDLVDLGEIITGGAQQIAVLIEPLGNIANNAYPRIDCDNTGVLQNSIFGQLSDLNAMQSSEIGNFLMDLWIQTNYNGKNIAYRQIPSYEYIGTNVYKNSELMAFVPKPDTFYIDQDLPPGYYDYCIATVYSADDGEHSWTSTLEEVCVNDVIADEDCIAPELYVVNTYENIVVFNFFVETSWNPIWLQYDNGVNVSAVGFGESFTYADRWLPENLSGFDGTYITKVKFFPVEGMADFTLKIWMGEEGDQLVYSQEIDDVEYNEWNIIDLDTFVEIIPENSLYVGFEVNPLDNVAGVAESYGSINADLVKVNGAEWQHLSDFGLDYCWNLGVYVDADKSLKNTKELLGFNLFRDGELLNDELITTTYYDTLPEPGLFCYNGTAVYSICGESDYGNEVCYDYGGTINTNEIIDNTYLFPNPATNQIRINSESLISDIQIFNSTGQIVLDESHINSKSYIVNTQSFKDGVYFIKIISKEKQEVKQFIIQN